MVWGEFGLMCAAICEVVLTSVGLAAIPFFTWRYISFGGTRRDTILASAGLSEHGECRVIFMG